MFGWFCVVCFAWLLFALSLFVFCSAWWNRGFVDEVTIASFCKAVTGTAVMARSANEEKKKNHVGANFVCDLPSIAINLPVNL